MFQLRKFFLTKKETKRVQFGENKVNITLEKKDAAMTAENKTGYVCNSKKVALQMTVILIQMQLNLTY